MEKTPLTPAQVFAATHVEYLIMELFNDPENVFTKITQLIDDSKLSENTDIMTYLYELLGTRGYVEYAEKFAEIYHIQSGMS
jgi:hypothetical protein